MRTSAWVVTLLAVGGCTSNQIFLETASDGETSETGETGESDGTETSPPAESGSDEGPPPECVDDWDCGDCGLCNGGVCEDWGGCCATPDPEGQWQWRCSPPWECYEDIDCGEGMVCNDGICEPDPGQPIVEPPLCRMDLALEIQQLALAAPLSHVAVPEPGYVRTIDGDLDLMLLDLATGPQPPAGPLEGEVAVDLVGTGPNAVVAFTEHTDANGELEHQLTWAWGAEDAWTMEPGPWALGSVRGAAWDGSSQELWVGSGTRIERWSLVGPTAIGDVELGIDVRAVASVPSAGGTELTVALADGSMRTVDAPTGEVLSATDPLPGLPVDLVSDGITIYMVSSLPADLADEADRTAVHRLQNEGSILDALPFGTPGVPLEAAVAEIDGNGVEDLLVATSEGRLDVYLMEADGPLCRLYLPTASIRDIEAGDVNGDGARDVLVVDSGPVVTAIFGAAP